MATSFVIGDFDLSTASGVVSYMYLYGKLYDASANHLGVPNQNINVYYYPDPRDPATRQLIATKLTNQWGEFTVDANNMPDFQIPASADYTHFGVEWVGNEHYAASSAWIPAGAVGT